MMQHANDSLAPPATQIQMPEHFSSEEDATHLYVPKAAQHFVDRFATSNVPRVQLPWVEDGAVRNHAVVASTTSASPVDRQRSFEQLKRMAAAGNDCATAMLEVLGDLKIE